MGMGGRPGRATAGYKRLIVAADGTWLNSDNGLMNGELSIPSNVTRISRAIKDVSSDGVPQVVYYHFGVGARGGMVDRFVQGKLLYFHSNRISWYGLVISIGVELYLFDLVREAHHA
jgi:uncharacterized protein (DUF2235 family)